MNLNLVPRGSWRIIKMLLKGVSPSRIAKEDLSLLLLNLESMFLIKIRLADLKLQQVLCLNMLQMLYKNCQIGKVLKFIKYIKRLELPTILKSLTLKILFNREEALTKRLKLLEFLVKMKNNFKNRIECLYILIFEFVFIL